MSHTETLPRPGRNVHIPLKTDEALAALLKVKPTKDMPRPGKAKAQKKVVKRSQRKA